MGFPRDQVYAALSQVGWNEEAAINVLLGGDGGGSGSSHPPNHSHQPKPKSGGGGGFFWGKNKV